MQSLQFLLTIIKAIDAKRKLINCFSSPLLSAKCHKNLLSLWITLLTDRQAEKQGKKTETPVLTGGHNRLWGWKLNHGGSAFFVFESIPTDSYLLNSAIVSFTMALQKPLAENTENTESCFIQFTVETTEAPVPFQVVLISVVLTGRKPERNHVLDATVVIPTSWCRHLYRGVGTERDSVQCQHS